MQQGIHHSPVSSRRVKVDDVRNLKYVKRAEQGTKIRQVRQHCGQILPRACSPSRGYPSSVSEKKASTNCTPEMPSACSPRSPPRCTCIESGIYSDMHCGSLGFDCLDPSAPEDCSTDSPTPSALYPDCMYSMDSFQDAFCDVLLNSAACGYDGGDCCECTCDESNASSTSSSTSRSAPCSPYYPCYDPYSGCANSVETDDVTYDSTYTFVGYCMPGPGTAGDGRCDSEYNNAECDYDSGDCCECNCVDGDEECGSNGYDCSDPRSLCYGSMVSAYADDDFVEASSGSHEEAAYVDCTATFVPTLGDGRCDITLNNAECSYDGGDCCKCTCVDGPEYTCGVEGYTCFQITCLNDDEEDDGAIEGNDAEDNSAAAVFPNTASPDRFTDVEIFGIVVLGAFGVAVLIGAIAASCWCARRKSTEAQGPGKVMSGRARLQPGVLQGRAPARDASARERPPAYGSGARHSGLPHDGESTGRFPDGDDVETGSARRAVDDESGRVVVAASAVGTKSAYLSSPPGTATPINPAWTPRGADEEKIHEFCAESEGEPSGDSNTTLKTPSSTHMVAAEAIGTATHGASPPASSESAAPLSEPVNETEPLKAEVVERDSGSHDRTGVDTRSAEEVVDGSNNPDEVVEDALRPGDVETAVPSSSDEADGPGSVDESRDGESRDGDGDAKTFESPDD